MFYIAIFSLELIREENQISTFTVPISYLSHYPAESDLPLADFLQQSTMALIAKLTIYGTFIFSITSSKCSRAFGYFSR